MLKAKGVTFAYGNSQVIDALDLEIKSGESVALVGPSGCGKSTLLSLLVGWVEPQHGTILVDSVSPQELRSRGQIGLILQDYGLLPWKSVRENLTLGPKLHHTELAQDALLQLVKELGLESVLDRRPSELSGGQKQRVALGRVLLLAPKLILLDEAFSAVDGFTREALQDLVKSIWQKHGQTLLVVTHDLSEAAMMGERILVCSGQPLRIHEVIANPGCREPDFRDSDLFQKTVRDIRKSMSFLAKGSPGV